MKNDRLLVLISSIFLVLGLAALSCMTACAKPAPEESITLRWAHPDTYKSMHGDILTWASTEVERRTGGKVRIVHYWAGSLVEWGNVLNGTRTGLCEIGSPWASSTPAETPLMNVGTLPVMSGDPYSMLLVQSELFRTPPIQAELDRFNVHYWMPMVWPPTIINSKFPITSADDLKGKKIDGYGHVLTLLERLGAVGVRESLYEIYVTLDRGIVDGCMRPLSSIYDYKLQEVAPYILWETLCFDLDGYVCINKDVWNKLSPDVQQVFNEVAEEQPRLLADYLERMIAEELEILQTEGVTLTHLTPEERAHWLKEAQVVWETWVQETGAAGVPAGEVFDTYMQLLAKYGVSPLA